MSRLSGLVHSLGNLERELRRRGVVQLELPEPEPGERERANRVWDEASEAERGDLALSGMRRADISLRQLHAIAAGEVELPWAVPDPELVARIERRTNMRRRLGLDDQRCVAGFETSCDCLADSLDDVGKRNALAAARKLHKARWPRFKPQPLPVPSVKPEPVLRSAPFTSDLTQTVPLNETNTKDVRIVRRARRWYDQDERISFRDRQF